jgi:hypothetical protein
MKRTANADSANIRRKELVNIQLEGRSSGASEGVVWAMRCGNIH